MFGGVQLTDYRRRRAIKRNNKQIALERISILFENAMEILVRDPELAQHYTDLARKIGMRYKVKMPTIYRRMICKGCKDLILPGVNCIVRTRTNREPHIVITCLNCGSYMRIPLKPREDSIEYSKTKITN